MAVNDITMFEPDAFGTIGTKKYYVAAGVTTINPGEPVGYKALGAGSYVIPLATSTPVVNTDYVVGIAQSTATNSTSSQTIDVFPFVKGAQYLISPKVAATYGLGSTPVQATYTVLVGSRVTFDLTGGVYTINSTDSSANGLVVEYIDVTKSMWQGCFLSSQQRAVRRILTFRSTFRANISTSRNKLTYKFNVYRTAKPRYCSHRIGFRVLSGIRV